MKQLGAGVLALLLLAGGFLVGRASGGVDDPKLRDSLAVYRDHRKEDKAAKDSLARVITAAQLQTRNAETEADRLRGSARAWELVAGRHGARADSLLARLPLALTPRDSNAILVNACTDRGLQCAALKTSNDSLKLAGLEDSTAKAGLRTEIGAHLAQRGRDSSRLGEADGLVRKLEKAARGCRLPIVGLRCPEALIGYGLDDRAFYAGGLVAVKLGPLGRVNLSVTTRIGGPRP